MSDQLPPEYFPPTVARMMRFYGCGESRSSVRATALQICPKCYQGPEDHKKVSAQPKLVHCEFSVEHVHPCYIEHGLLPALRTFYANLRASVKVDSDLPLTRITVTWPVLDNDAALLELAGVPGAMSPGQATSAGSAPASSLPHVEATAPSGRILFAAESVLAAHEGRQAAEPAERPLSPAHDPLFWHARMSDAYNRGQCEAFLEAAKMAQAMLDRLPPAPNPLVGLMVDLIDWLEARAKDISNPTIDPAPAKPQRIHLPDGRPLPHP